MWVCRRWNINHCRPSNWAIYDHITCAYPSSNPAWLHNAHHNVPILSYAIDVCVWFTIAWLTLGLSATTYMKSRSPRWMQLLLSLQHMTDLRKRVTLNRHRNVLQVTAPVVLYVDAYIKKKKNSCLAGPVFAKDAAPLIKMQCSEGEASVWFFIVFVTAP